MIVCSPVVLLYLFSEFPDPDEEERTLYIQYWQNKLQGNKKISFPDSLVKEIASETDGFSFAYLKEALYVICPSTRFTCAHYPLVRCAACRLSSS